MGRKKSKTVTIPREQFEAMKRDHQRVKDIISRQLSIYHDPFHGWGVETQSEFFAGRKHLRDAIDRAVRGQR